VAVAPTNLHLPHGDRASVPTDTRLASPAALASPQGAAVPASLRHPWTLPLLVLEEARYPVLAVFVLRIAAASHLLTHPGWNAAAVGIAWLALTTSAYVFNGISDRASDRANGSRRPIASGRLGVRTAYTASALLAAFGLAVCCLVGLWQGIAGVVSLFLGWAYSAGPCLKRSSLLCGATVATTTSLTFLVGTLSVHAPARISVAFVLWAAWVGVASPAKDLSDVSGDRLAGRRTLAVRLGHVGAARVVAVTSVGWAVIFGVAATILAPRFLPVALVAIVGTLLMAAALLKVRPEQDRAELRRPYRFLMLTQFAVTLAFVPCWA
jgi:4-hydroxybenzoate polyprenyltransferase